MDKTTLSSLIGPFPQKVKMNSEIVLSENCGSYTREKVIIDTEAEFKKRNLLDHIKLFVLIDSSFKCVTDRDDGNSLSQASLELAEKEQILFLEVFKWTSITSKKLIDIANKSIEEVSNLIVSSE